MTKQKYTIDYVIDIDVSLVGDELKEYIIEMEDKYELQIIIKREQQPSGYPVLKLVGSDSEIKAYLRNEYFKPFEAALARKYFKDYVRSAA